MEYEDDFESQFAEELEVIREQEKGEYFSTGTVASGGQVRD